MNVKAALSSLGQFLKTQPLVTFGIVLGAALVMSFNALSGAINARQADEYIAVTGSASKTITADHAEWNIRFSRQGKDLKGTYAAMSHDVATVKAFLKKQGIADNSVSVGSIESTTLYAKNSQGYDSNTVDAYKLQQSILVEADDPKVIETLSQQAIELVNKGLVLDSQAPEYLFTKLDDLKIDMIGEATKNAVERGRKIAQSTGRDVGVLRSAQVGVFQITPKNSTEVSDYGLYDTTSVEKKVTAVVNASFSIR